MAEEKKERIANNVMRVQGQGKPLSLDGSFFRTFIEFLTPFHNLANREKDVLAAFIKERYFLSQSITDPQLLDKVLMNDDTKAKIKKECNVSDAFFSGILGKLRKADVIIDNAINPLYLPKRVSSGDKSFKLMFVFEIQ